MEQLSPSTLNSSERDQYRNRRARKPLSCDPCRHSKLKCDRQLPCATCLKRGWQDSCAYGSNFSRPQRRHGTRTGNAASLSQSRCQAQLTETPEPASPQSEPIHRRWDSILRRPSVERNSAVRTPTEVTFTLFFGPSTPKSELLAMLPPSSICEYLITRYFSLLSPLFHVLHGPTFQKQYSAFLGNSEQASLSWIALLFAICSLTLKTLNIDDIGLTELWQDSTSLRDLSVYSRRYRDAAMMALAQDQFLVFHDLNTLETLLILVYTISHSEGPEYGWALLGAALNISIALRCHVDTQESDCIERERRRRCWAGVLVLHTHQLLCFRDINLRFLFDMEAKMPLWINDVDIHEHTITESLQESSSRPTDMSLMKFQVHLFQLSTQICSHITGSDRLNHQTLRQFDDAIGNEQRQWDSLYLVNGARSILNTAGYAHWCILQTYAHQLYLLLHRPFHSSRSSHFRTDSRDRCVKSGLALLDIHHHFYELPRLNCYRWLVKGAISCNALHGAVALTSCILDMPRDCGRAEHVSAIDAVVRRLKALKDKSPACSNIYPILCCLS